MMSYSFKNDYAEGCHPRILQALTATNLEQQPGYGEDAYSREAKALICEKFKCPEAAVYFLSGGTQTNLVLISAALRPHHSVISAATGHIFTNEAGAVEATGHKVHAALSTDGKLTPKACEEVLATVTNTPHVVRPKLVYISNATELGTHYSLEELRALSAFCREKGFYLFLDGARLGQALAVEQASLQPADVANLVDAFYIGGTKNGALFGEALVVLNQELKEELAFQIKQKGALLAKGRGVGLQFLTLMNDDLFWDLGRRANTQAGKLKKAFQSLDCAFLTDTATNQLFPILTNTQIRRLQEVAEFYIWEKQGTGKSAIRIITSWATPDEEIEKMVTAIKKL